jgi:ribonuclease-3
MPIDVSLYEKALRHSSYISDKDARLTNDNQRLEFLGDAVLSAVVAEYLYKNFPDKDEGYLTNLRSIIVSRKSLNDVAQKIGVHRLVKKKLDKNKRAHSINGDAFEALIGAIYLDRGLNYTHDFILNKVIIPFWGDKKLENHVISYKSALIEWAQKNKIDYKLELLQEWGKKHALTFEVAVIVDGEEISRGQGTSKKRAEEAASKKAYIELKI